MMTLFFTKRNKISNYNDALECDNLIYSQYFKLMLEMGIYLPPSQYECLFISSKISKQDISKIIKSNKKALEFLKK